MSVVWFNFVDWEPRVGDVGDSRFQHPDQPFGRDALEQLIEELNNGPDPDISFDGSIVTRDLMQLMKEKAEDRLIPGLFPFFRSEFPLGSNYEEYAWDTVSERLLNQSDIFHCRRRCGQYVPFQNESFTVIAFEAPAVGDTVWQYKQFGFLTGAQEDTAYFSMFGFSDTISNFRFTHTDNTLTTVINEPGIRLVQVGVFVNVYQDFLGDYWERQYDGFIGDYTVDLIETDTHWSFVFQPTLGLAPSIEVSLYWYAPLVDTQLPGKLIFLDDTPQIVTVKKGTIGALRVTGLVGADRISNIKLDTQLPMIESVSLEGGTVKLGQEGYGTPGDALADSTSPHKIVVQFDVPLESEIQLYLQIKGHPVHSRGAQRGVTFLQDYPSASVLTIDPNGGDLEALNTRVGLEISADKKTLKFPFIPANWTGLGWTIDDISHTNTRYRLGAGHKTPALYSVGAISGCVGGAAIQAEAQDGDVVDEDFTWQNNP